MYARATAAFVADPVALVFGPLDPETGTRPLCSPHAAAGVPVAATILAVAAVA